MESKSGVFKVQMYAIAAAIGLVSIVGMSGPAAALACRCPSALI